MAGLMALSTSACFIGSWPTIAVKGKTLRPLCIARIVANGIRSGGHPAPPSMRMAMGGETWIVVLVKEPSTAKTRLAAVLSGSERARLAEECAIRALAAAVAAAPTLAVCAGPAAAALAERSGVEAVVEPRPEGQNPAGARGLDAVAARGGTACLLLSSDLPLVETTSLRQFGSTGPRPSRARWWWPLPLSVARAPMPCT